MGMQIYIRNVPYSGNVPDAHAARWANVQATQALANSIAKVGDSVSRFGQRLSEDEEREGRINAIRGQAALEEHTRTLLKDAPRMQWTDDNGLSRHHTMVDAWKDGYEVDGEEREGYAAMKQSIASGLPKWMQAEWLADIEATHEPRWREAVEERSRELREEYITNAASAVVRGPGMAGDIGAAEMKRRQVMDLFDKSEWKDISDSVDTEVALGIARYDADLAREYSEAHIQPAKRKKLDTAIEQESRASKIEQRRAQEEAQEKANARVTAQYLAYEAGEGVRPRPADIIFQVEHGIIDRSVGERILDGLTKERKIDPSTHATAYAALERMAPLVQAGKISRQRWYSILKAHGPEVTAEEEAMFVARANAAKGADPESSVRSDAEKLATETMKRLYPDPPTGAKPTGETNTLKVDTAVTRIMQELTTYASEQRALGKPLDVIAYRTKANEIIDRIYREEYNAKYPPAGKSLVQKYGNAGQPHYLRVRRPDGKVGRITDPEEIRKVMNGELEGWSVAK